MNSSINDYWVFSLNRKHLLVTLLCLKFIGIWSKIRQTMIAVCLDGQRQYFLILSLPLSLSPSLLLLLFLAFPLGNTTFSFSYNSTVYLILSVLLHKILKPLKKTNCGLGQYLFGSWGIVQCLWHSEPEVNNETKWSRMVVPHPG